VIGHTGIHPDMEIRRSVAAQRDRLKAPLRATKEPNMFLAQGQQIKFLLSAED
jgi:hypothetical protein